jgi:hypothetical protein
VNPQDELLARAQEAAKAILQEAGELRGPVLICEIDGGGLSIIWDDELPTQTLARALRATADALDGIS